MKIKVIIGTVILLGLFVLQGVAGNNVMKVKDAQAQPGGVVTIEVEIVNEDAFAGFNMDIPLPAGFSYVEGTATLYRENGHTLSFAIVSGNIARALSFAIPTANFLGSEGVVLSFDVQTPNTEGDYIFNLTNAVIANSDGENILTGTQPGTLTLEDTSFSENIMRVLDANATAASVVTIEVEIANDAPFAAFNFDLSLPPGFVYVEGSATLFRDDGHSLTFSIIPGNIARALSFAIPTTNFLGSEGVVLSFDVQTPNAEGVYIFNLTNAVIADSDGENILTGTQSGTLTLEDTSFSENLMRVLHANATAGSVVTIEVEIANDNPFAAFNFDLSLPPGFVYVEGSATLFRDDGHSLTFSIIPGNIARALSFAIPTTNFLGNSGVVLSFDVTTPLTAGMHIMSVTNAVIADSDGENILTGTQSGVITLDEALTGNNMLINDIVGVAGSVITIEMEIINDDLFAGFNVDIPLPAGFTFVPGTAALFRGNGHSLSFSIISPNTARALSFAIPTTNFSGNSGVVLSFDVETPAIAGIYNLNIENAVITDSNGINILSGTYPGTVHLLDPLDGYLLDVKVILEGPYTPGQVDLMHTNLYDNGFLPYAHPFNPPLPYYGNSSPVWFYTGDETVASIPPGTVDWVLLELRDAASPSQALSGTIVARKAVFLHKDGQIRGLDGTLPLFNAPILQNLYVVVYHRNHLAVMSSGQLTLFGGIYSWDFTVGSEKAYSPFSQRSAYLQGHKHLGDGIYGLYGGDGDANGQVQTQDKNEVWSYQSGLSGNWPGDFDMNGQVQTQDKNNIWNPNSGAASQVP